MFVPPGPVDVVVHVIRVHSEAGHVVDHNLDGVVGPSPGVGDGVQLGLEELGDVKEDGAQHGGQEVGEDAGPRAVCQL